MQRLHPVLVALAFGIVGCGGADDAAAPTTPAYAGASSTGGGSASAGATNSAGRAGAAQAGNAGHAASGEAGAGGASGHGASGAGGAAGHGVAGMTGTGGTAGAKGGSAGASGQTGVAGTSGAAGAGGAGMSCTNDASCTSQIPVTVPANCAIGVCDTTKHECTFAAKDADGDKHPTAVCKADDGTPIVVGDDCDDTNPIVYPTAWDGPKGDGEPDRCDGIDEDCDGIADDGKLKDGTTCTCMPGDQQKCSTGANGQPIVFPKLDSDGKPLGMYCKIGSSTCGNDGKWSPCTGAIGPLPADLCDGLDENCNGLVDTADTVPPVGQITYTFDGDLDNHASSDPMAKQSGCPGKPPTVCPSYCTLTCAPTMQWRTGTFPLDDCNDNDPNVYPGAVEKCNGIDDDCNMLVDDNAIDAKTWVFDYDNDKYGDINIDSVRSCNQPTTVPAICTTALMNVPAGYCAGRPEEGSPPVCPPPACDATMWQSGYPATDCKDNPGEGSASEGNSPRLVHPGGADLCNGLDYACQANPDIGCGSCTLGATQICGSSATCNPTNSQTCISGGVWGPCMGPMDQTPVDYCKDQDKDTFCDVSNCLTALCPADVPTDVFWRPRTQCYQQGLGVTDCDDTKAAVHPDQSEVCSGDGTDYNCNSFPNTPGQGDCDCNSTGPDTQTTVDCRPAVGWYPPGATPGQPALDMPGHVTGTMLYGVCKWGTATCDSTGHLGPCQGASPGAGMSEVCNNDGLDYNCNNVPNTVKSECACTNGATQACDTNPNVCNKGCVQTCAGGVWSTATTGPAQQLAFGDSDGDGTCSAASATKCPPNTSPGGMAYEFAPDCYENDPVHAVGAPPWTWRLSRNCIGAGSWADCNDSDTKVRPYFSQPDTNACNSGPGGAWTHVGNPGAERCDTYDHDCYNGPHDGAACSDTVTFSIASPYLIPGDDFTKVAGDSTFGNSGVTETMISTLTYTLVGSEVSLNFGPVTITENSGDHSSVKWAGTGFLSSKPVKCPSCTLTSIPYNQVAGCPTNTASSVCDNYSMISVLNGTEEMTSGTVPNHAPFGDSTGTLTCNTSGTWSATGVCGADVQSGCVGCTFTVPAGYQLQVVDAVVPAPTELP